MGHIVKANAREGNSQAGLRVDSEAEQQGFAQGMAAGREAGLALVTEKLVAADLAIEKAWNAARENVLVLARRMAEKIVGRAVDVDPSLMGEMAGKALESCKVGGGSVVLRVHPEDIAAVEGARSRWCPQVTTAAKVCLIADASVGRSGCVVETPIGRLDARLQTQLEALERALRVTARTP
jgi:flagellar biosynthesis/type III secretory pathway protein FliH